jgi:hypothetical protein
VEIEELQKGYTQSPLHVRWLLRTSQFLEEVFGPSSMVTVNFRRIPWRYSGTMMVTYREAFVPGAAQQLYDMPVYIEGLGRALGVLMAAQDQMVRSGVDAVYEGKDSGPEASLILRVLNLAEVKLRKVLREKPQKEREVQDAFEGLLIGADIPYSREKDSIEYSSKKYIPDFTVPKADLAVEIKLSAKEEHEKELIAQINDDILAYRTAFGNLLFVVYDCGFIRDVDRFISSFEAHQAVSVRVVKH